MSELRNLMMAAANGGADPVPEGWQIDTGALSTGNNTFPNTRLVMTDFYSVTPGHSIKVRFGANGLSGNTFLAFEYDAGKNKLDYWPVNTSGDTRRFTAKANTAYVNAVVNYYNIDDVYIMDETTGEYLYKGKNVQ